MASDQPTEQQELYNALLRAKKRRNRYTRDESYYETYFNAHGYESKQPENRVSEWIVIGARAAFRQSGLIPRLVSC
jgi:hypothetical protein